MRRNSYGLPTTADFGRLAAMIGSPLVACATTSMPTGWSTGMPRPSATRTRKLCGTNGLSVGVTVGVQVRSPLAGSIAMPTGGPTRL